MNHNIFLVEKFNPGGQHLVEPFHFFCSERCACTIYSDEEVRTESEDSLWDKTKIKLDEKRCFFCGDSLLLTRRD